MKKITLSILALNLIVLSVRAQSYIWEKTTDVGFASVRALAAKGNTIFAGSTNKGVYQSSDGGNTWLPRNGTVPENQFEVYSLLIDGNDLFAGANGMFLEGVYKSTNFGLSWTNIAPPNFFTERAYCLLSANGDLYMGTGGGGLIYKSSLNTVNSGSWLTYTTGLGSGVQINALDFNGNKLFAGTSVSGVCTSPTNTASWLGTNGTGSFPINALCINGSHVFAANGSGNPSLFYSSDNGQNFNSLNSPAFSNLAVRALIHTGDTIYAGTFGVNSGVIVSYDNGANWQSLNQGFNCNAMNVYSFAFMSGTLYAGSDCGIWKLVPNTVGLSETELFNEIKIGPNPSKGIIQILSPQLAAGSVQLYDIQGKLLFEKTLSKETTIDLTSYSQGVYLIKILDAKGVEKISQKVIRE